MLESSMLAGLNSLINLIEKAYKTIRNNSSKEIKTDLIELCYLVHDTSLCATRLLDKIGNAKNIEEICDKNVTYQYIKIDLTSQLFRLKRIDEILKTNKLMELNSSLREDFTHLVEWKKGLLFGYGAQIQFFYLLGGRNDSASNSGSTKQEQLDILRFCFFNSRPKSNINRKKIENNIRALKKSLTILEEEVKKFLTPDEIIAMSKEARERANRRSIIDPMTILN